MGGRFFFFLFDKSLQVFFVWVFINLGDCYWGVFNGEIGEIGNWGIGKIRVVEGVFF